MKKIKGDPSSKSHSEMGSISVSSLVSSYESELSFEGNENE